MGYVRVAAASPALSVADVNSNVAEICGAVRQAASEQCQLILLPELAITGYSCGDLFYQSLLLAQARSSLQLIADVSRELDVTIVVGLPLLVEGRIYNCAAFVSRGVVAGIVPKTFLPNTNEYYEQRWFTSGRHNRCSAVEINGTETPFGSDLIFNATNIRDCIVGIEICEDLWAIEPPSGQQACAGATLLLNPSASDELLGKSAYRRDLVKQQSARCLAAYVYAGSGPCESTTDVVFGGHSIIAENGAVLTESERFRFTTQLVIADVDIERLAQERMRNSSYSMSPPSRPFRSVDFTLSERTLGSDQTYLLKRSIPRSPFVPADLNQRSKHCREVFSIQSTGLARRLSHTHSSTAVIGVSGGLDSTLALLVVSQAYQILGWSNEQILAVTMPGFGTTGRTRKNAVRLIELLGATHRLIPIQNAVHQHFADIGHNPEVHDVTYENSQARERTQILMDLANAHDGLVIGTGDLSELALGWCTYNGDHMSMYNVNVGVPKTLVRYLVEWVAQSEFSGEIADVLHDICATPITPELLPLGADDSLTQKTEESIGPYELHDFFLFNAVRHQFSPDKILLLARQAFGEDYTASEILRWMRVFYGRFFSQQFKRSALPDGPKVGSVALSPRGDWRMPSDASPQLWLANLDEIDL
jgi:NAD+ synthase (glutamine-hydrolysing)